MSVLRVWRAPIDEKRADEYERFARDRSLPMFRRQEGFLGVLFARAREECVVVTVWRDEDAVARLAASPSYQETVAAISASGLLVGDASAEVYNLHAVEVGAGGFATPASSP